MSADIGVSVIIPCRNEENYIEKCIYSIIYGTKKEISVEILVIDGISTDRTSSIISDINKKFPNVKRIENKDIETQIALNIGVRNAVYDYVMIAGAHSEFPSGYIETLLSGMEHLNADGVGGSLKTDVLNKTRTSHAIVKVLSHPAGVGNSMFRIGADLPVKVDTVPFGIYRKQLFEEVGFYDVRLKRNHDMEWSKRLLRAGKKIYLIPDMQCTYFAREKYSLLALNNYRNGLWNLLAVCITRTFRSLSLRHFVPFMFIFSLLFSFVAGVFCKFFLFAGLAILSVYLLIIVFFSAKLNNRNTTLLHLIWGFIVLHFSYGAGSMIGLIKCFTGKNK